MNVETGAFSWNNSGLRSSEKEVFYSVNVAIERSKPACNSHLEWLVRDRSEIDGHRPSSSNGIQPVDLSGILSLDSPNVVLHLELQALNARAILHQARKRTG